MSWPRLSINIHFSPFPSQIGFCVLGITSSLVIFLNTSIFFLFITNSFFVLFCAYFWWAELLEEFEAGEESLQVTDNLNLSFSLLVFSEAMLFVTFFWTFFHYSFSPPLWVGHVWPPLGLIPISPNGVPLLNTFLLVSSGVTVTWGHHILLLGDNKTSLNVFFYTILLGSWFLLNQVIEFNEASFNISDSVLGSVFFVLTGLHGFHVFLGLFMLVEATDALHKFSCSSFSHTNLEMLIWYWHFVDCIWLVVYSFIYWWGS